jgi:hypothetical protein
VASLSILEYLYTGFLEAFGYQWLIFVMAGLFVLGAMLVAVRYSPIWGIGVASIPFVLFSIQVGISIAWVLPAIVLVLGLIMYLSIAKLVGAQ